jgi:hypothetical protein
MQAWSSGAVAAVAALDRGAAIEEQRDRVALALAHRLDERGVGEIVAVRAIDVGAAVEERDDHVAIAAGRREGERGARLVDERVAIGGVGESRSDARPVAREHELGPHARERSSVQ